MVSLGALRLTLNDRPDGTGKILLERLAITRHCSVFPAFAFVEHGLVAVTAKRAANRNPSTVKRTADGTALIGLPAQLPYQCLKFLPGTAALAGAAEQHCLDIR